MNVGRYIYVCMGTCIYFLFRLKCAQIVLFSPLCYRTELFLQFIIIFFGDNAMISSRSTQQYLCTRVILRERVKWSLCVFNSIYVHCNLCTHSTRASRRAERVINVRMTLTVNPKMLNFDIHCSEEDL